MSKEDKAKLEDVPVEESLSEFLRHWERNLWLYGSLVISFATIIVVYGTPAEAPIEVPEFSAITVVAFSAFAALLYLLRRKRK